MNNQMPGYMPNMYYPNMYNQNQELQRLIERLNMLERDVRRLDNRINRLEQNNNNYNPNTKYKSDSYNMF